MYLRSLIQKRLAQSNLHLFDRDGKKIPASQIQKEYNQIKAYLTNYVYEDKALAIMSTKDYRYMLTMLACMEIGLPYIPLKNNYPQDRVEQIRKEIYFSTVMTDALLEEILSKEITQTKKLREVSENDPLYIIFTSGSTGRPKGVVIPRRAFENFSLWIDDYFGHINENHHVLQVTEFTFDISLNEVAFFLTKNVYLYFSQFEKDYFRLAFEIETYEINVLSTVPNNLNMLLEDLLYERANYSSLQTILVSGARFSFGLYERCKRYFKDKFVYNLYGPTECTVYTHSKKLDFSEADLSDHTVSIGYPLTNLHALIKDNELLLGGKQLMLGYANNPERTHEALIQIDGTHYYKSGDICFLGEKDQFFITGRKDDTIKYRGFRINLLDIDSYINRLDYVSDSATIAVPDELRENLTICFLKLNNIEKKVDEIKKELGNLLLEYQIPEKIFFIKEYPVNTSGKVCKKQLTELYLKEYR